MNEYWMKHLYATQPLWGFLVYFRPLKQFFGLLFCSIYNQNVAWTDHKTTQKVEKSVVIK